MYLINLITAVYTCRILSSTCFRILVTYSLRHFLTLVQRRRRPKIVCSCEDASHWLWRSRRAVRVFWSDVGSVNGILKRAQSETSCLRHHLLPRNDKCTKTSWSGRERGSNGSVWPRGCLSSCPVTSRWETERFNTVRERRDEWEQRNQPGNTRVPWTGTLLWLSGLASC